MPRPRRPDPPRARRRCPDHPAGPLVEYPTGSGLPGCASARAVGPGPCGRSPRARRRAATGPLGLASAARACAESGRGAVIVAPDQRDLDSAARRLHPAAGSGRLRRADRRGGAGRPVPRVPGRAARRGQGGDRQSGGGVRAGPRSRSGRPVGRRGRSAVRAPVALPAHPGGAGPAGGRGPGRRTLRRLQPDGRGADLARPRLVDRARRRPAGGPAHRAAGPGHRRLRSRPGARLRPPGPPGCRTRSSS